MMIGRLNSIGSAPAEKSGSHTQNLSGATFRQILEEKQQPSQQTQTVAFSKHAMARAEERGIQVDDTLVHQLSDSVEKAKAKGARNILALDDTRAFIINVPNLRVITAISQEELRENIFTNIDGAVIL